MFVSKYDTLWLGKFIVEWRVGKDDPRDLSGPGYIFLWHPVKNKNVKPFLQKLLRISVVTREHYTSVGLF